MQARRIPRPYTCRPAPRRHFDLLPTLLSSILVPLVPVILCIGIGYLTARVGWVRATAVPDLSNIVFLVLTPALLFRTMGHVRLQELDFQPVLLYFSAAALLFGLTLAFSRFSTAAAARALAYTFSNLVMIGAPLMGLVYGPQGLVTLFTLVSLHSLVLLTAATMVFELAEAREQQRTGSAAPRPMAHTVWQAVRNSIVHPVPLPILAGLLFAQTGWKLPEMLDRPLQVLAAALGLSGPAIAVMFTAAAMPVGANVLLFTQRYGVMQEEVSSAIALSTALALITLPVVLVLAQFFMH